MKGPVRSSTCRRAWSGRQQILPCLSNLGCVNAYLRASERLATWDMWASQSCLERVGEPVPVVNRVTKTVRQRMSNTTGRLPDAGSRSNIRLVGCAAIKVLLKQIVIIGRNTPPAREPWPGWLTVNSGVASHDPSIGVGALRPF